MFRTLIYQELATVLLNYHIGRFVLSSLCVGDLLLLVLSSARVAGVVVSWRFVAVRFE